jgi:hypothetical protein
MQVQFSAVSDRTDVAVMEGDFMAVGEIGKKPTRKVFTKGPVLFMRFGDTYVVDAGDDRRLFRSLNWPESTDADPSAWPTSAWSPYDQCFVAVVHSASDIRKATVFGNQSVVVSHDGTLTWYRFGYKPWSTDFFQEHFAFDLCLLNGHLFVLTAECVFHFDRFEDEFANNTRIGFPNDESKFTNMCVNTTKIILWGLDCKPLSFEHRTRTPPLLAEPLLNPVNRARQSVSSLFFTGLKNFPVHPLFDSSLQRIVVAKTEALNLSPFNKIALTRVSAKDAELLSPAKAIVGGISLMARPDFVEINGMSARSHLCRLFDEVYNKRLTLKEKADLAVNRDFLAKAFDHLKDAKDFDLSRVITVSDSPNCNYVHVVTHDLVFDVLFDWQYAGHRVPTPLQKADRISFCGAPFLREFRMPSEGELSARLRANEIVSFVTTSRSEKSARNQFAALRPLKPSAPKKEESVRKIAVAAEIGDVKNASWTEEKFHSSDNKSQIVAHWLKLNNLYYVYEEKPVSFGIAHEQQRILKLDRPKYAIDPSAMDPPVVDLGKMLDYVDTIVSIHTTRHKGDWKARCQATTSWMATIDIDSWFSLLSSVYAKDVSLSSGKMKERWGWWAANLISQREFTGSPFKSYPVLDTNAIPKMNSIQELLQDYEHLQTGTNDLKDAVSQYLSLLNPSFSNGFPLRLYHLVFFWSKPREARRTETAVAMYKAKFGKVEDVLCFIETIGHGMSAGAIWRAYAAAAFTPAFADFDRYIEKIAGLEGLLPPPPLTKTDTRSRVREFIHAYDKFFDFNSVRTLVRIDLLGSFAQRREGENNPSKAYEKLVQIRRQQTGNRSFARSSDSENGISWVSFGFQAISVVDATEEGIEKASQTFGKAPKPLFVFHKKMSDAELAEWCDRCDEWYYEDGDFYYASSKAIKGEPFPREKIPRSAEEYVKRKVKPWRLLDKEINNYLIDSSSSSTTIMVRASSIDAKLQDILKFLDEPQKADKPKGLVERVTLTSPSGVVLLLRLSASSRHRELLADLRQMGLFAHLVREHSVDLVMESMFSAGATSNLQVEGTKKKRHSRIHWRAAHMSFDRNSDMVFTSARPFTLGNPPPHSNLESLKESLDRFVSILGTEISREVTEVRVVPLSFFVKNFPTEKVVAIAKENAQEYKRISEAIEDGSFYVTKNSLFLSVPIESTKFSAIVTDGQVVFDRFPVASSPGFWNATITKTRKLLEQGNLLSF